MKRPHWSALPFSLAEFGLVLAISAITAEPASGQTADVAGTILNVLAPGQFGGLPFNTHTNDQIPLYDGLTPKFDAVTPADLTLFYKAESFGLGGASPERVENPPGRPGLTIQRDRYDVPHISGAARDDVMFGAGWVAAEDRGLLIEVLRGPGRIAALDAPGLDAFSLASSLRRFTPSVETEAFLNKQEALLKRRGRRGARVLGDIHAYVDGINAYNQSVGATTAPWTQADVLATASLIGAVFGRGGGDEAARSEILSALQLRLGSGAGRAVWDDLREQQDPEAPVSIDRSFPYGSTAASSSGNAVIDNGSAPAFRPAAASGHASNALLVSASRSATGHPLFVAGPQVGYFHPEILMEIDIHGGGVDARGATFPGSAPYVLLGRGKDFSWSATSADSDLVDQYVEELCGDDTHYRYRGRCRAMTTFNAGQLEGPTEPVVFRETVHGPVLGYATVQGRRVAISEKRATRGREVLNAFAFADLNDSTVSSARTFLKTMAQIEFTFNWFYADDHDIAMFSSGRLPKRPRGIDSGLPTVGTGRYEWRGFLSPAQHAQVINPPSGAIVNWNNKSARDFGAADNNWGRGSIHRSLLLQHALDRNSTHTLDSVVAAMNRAATQDLRVMEVLPALAAVLDTGPAPTPRAAQILQLLKDWRAAGGSRLDRDLDGKIDDPGAAILDQAWPSITDAVMGPVLGEQLAQLASLMTRDNAPSSQGSAYLDGWYGYVDKDLRTIAGQPVEGAFHTKFCGRGDLTACRSDLWAALDAAGAALETTQGADPTAWRADATHERIRFAPGLLADSMRWTNRSTFQQVVSFTAHRAPR